MFVSEKRIAANRSNSKKSTGPSEAGKEISRANSLQHGMTGAGVVMLPSDEKEVERRVVAYRNELSPRGQLQADLVRRAALYAVRMERCATQDAEATAVRVRNASDDFDDARHEEAERLMENLASDPTGNLRRLRRMPEGVDRLIFAWTELRRDLAFPADYRLDDTRMHRGETLSGRVAGSLGVSRYVALLKAIRCRFESLEPGELDGVENDDQYAWAMKRLLAWVDAQIAELVAHRATLDLGRIAADRASAPKVALFDHSRAAAMARKYEAAAERSFHRALRELKALQKPQSAVTINPSCPDYRMASFSPPEYKPERPASDGGGRGSTMPSNTLGFTIGRPPGGPG